MTADAFPLHWPDGWPRASGRAVAAYRVSLAKARDDLLHELFLMGADAIVISSNATPRVDNTPASGAPAAPQGDPGVAVYFHRKGEQQVIACDQWHRLSDNLRACGLTVAALRMIDRAGATDLLNRAFSGFKALPEHKPIDVPEWWHVLGVPASASTSKVRAVYKRLASENHPDTGGDAGAMARISQAWRSFKEERGV